MNGGKNVKFSWRFLWGLQCPKLLWHAYNAKDLIPESRSTFAMANLSVPMPLGW